MKPYFAKYKAIPTIVNGIRFASKREANRYKELLLMVMAKKISDLTLQPPFTFPCGVKYKGDFSYIENGVRIYEDVKGFKTPVFNLKMRMMKHHYPEVILRIIK